ncbi:GAF domain-containing protein [Actinoplanes philippinensis]|uniref:GAF domain-containing protein n=1 Tax=Actinoplanes philippinensis TaxID=35752 RepID=UPI001944F28E|nr:GAF domain-containing protein [Actinoplanes philippinensis]
MSRLLSKDDMLRDVVAALSRARTLAVVQQLVRTSARLLSDAHGATVVLRDGDRCYYADEDAISPLWKGQRFPITECISGWAMLARLPAVVPDIRLDERIPMDAYRPTFVRSLAMIPVRPADPLGAVGVYWSTARRATDEQLALLSTLADATGAALERLLPETHAL